LKKFLVFLLAVLLIVQISIVKGSQEPNLLVTVAEDSANVRWKIRFLFEEHESYGQKIDEIHKAFENNYDRKLEVLLEDFLSEEFSRHLERRVEVADLRINLRGSGSSWSEWMEVSTEFTVKGIAVKREGSLHVDMSWLTIKLSDRKVSFEDRDDPEIVYSFYPKYTLGINWEDCFNWNLNSRTPEQKGDSVVLSLPSRHEYKPFQEYSGVHTSPEKPLLEIRVMNSKATFEARQVVIPIPPRPPTNQELLVQLLRNNWMAVVGSIVVIGGMLLFGRYQVRRQGRLLLEKQRKRQVLEQLRPLSEELRSEYGTRKVSLIPVRAKASAKHVEVSKRTQERLFGKSASEDWHTVLRRARRSLVKFFGR